MVKEQDNEVDNRFSEFRKENWNFARRRNNKSQSSLVEYFREYPVNPGSNTLYREGTLLIAVML